MENSVIVIELYCERKIKDKQLEEINYNITY